MIALPETIRQKSTIVRSKIGALHRGAGRRYGPDRSPPVWGDRARGPDAARAYKPPVGRARTGADRLERLATRLLTLIAAGYGISVLVRIVAMYG